MGSMGCADNNAAIIETSHELIWARMLSPQAQSTVKKSSTMWSSAGPALRSSGSVLNVNQLTDQSHGCTPLERHGLPWMFSLFRARRGVKQALICVLQGRLPSGSEPQVFGR